MLQYCTIVIPVIKAELNLAAFPWKKDPVDVNDYYGCLIMCTNHDAFEHDIGRFDCTLVDGDIGGVLCVINGKYVQNIFLE